MDKLLKNTCGDNLPEAFLTRMQDLLGEDEYMAFLSAYGQKRFYSLRVNPLKTDREKAMRLLDQAALSGSDHVSGSDDHLRQECLQPVPWEPDGFYYPEEFRPGRLPWHEAGMYYIQEASAMAPAVLCDAQPGERVLDLCAAPGGKSTKLAAALKGRGILVANEIHPERAKILSSNLERMGVRNTLVTNEPSHRLASRFPLFFDRIVVDAPCSGEGMFRKEEEALVQWNPENVRMCAERQAEILEEAASMLRPGGRLVYSTCTFSPEENERVIYRFIVDHPDFSVVNIPDMPGIRAEEWGFACGRPEWIPEAERRNGSCGISREDTAQQLRGTVRLWPHLLNGEGHFAAVLRKDGPQSEAAAAQSAQTSCDRIRETPCGISTRRDAHGSGMAGKKEKGKGRGRSGGKRQDGELSIMEIQRLWEEFCRDNLIPCNTPDAVTSVSEDRLCRFGNALFKLPLPAWQLSLDGLRVLRAGLHLGTVNRGRFEPSHALAMALRREEVRRVTEFAGDSPEAYAWIRGESVNALDTAEKGWTLVLIDGCSAGWAKASGGMLKNHYPKGIRKGSSYRKP